MKLFTRLTLFITLSKFCIIILFVGLLPLLVRKVASRYTNNALREQRAKVLKQVAHQGVDYYLQGEESYGSYTLLKEEYISLEPVSGYLPKDTIETALRIIDKDTLSYRVLTHVLSYGGRSYILEIGKAELLIDQYSRPLQKMALYVLITLIVITIVVDLLYTRFLLRPLDVIIRTKLVNSRFPFKKKIQPVATSTKDFRYLDQALNTLMERVHDDFERERAFTANASHELMTPIGILQNKMENLIADGELSDEAVEKVEGMRKTLNRLKKIVNSLLLISRIENDQFGKNDTLDPEVWVNEVMEELDHRLEQRNIAFSLKLSDKVLLQQVNRDLLFQLLYNLVNNAIRYNRDGGNIIVTDSYDPRGYYTLFIADTGEGIDAAAQAHIFDRFKKSKGSAEQSFGLGLAIVKAIADYHNATITVQSEAGKGSRFGIVFTAAHLS